MNKTHRKSSTLLNSQLWRFSLKFEVCMIQLWSKFAATSAQNPCKRFLVLYDLPLNATFWFEIADLKFCHFWPESTLQLILLRILAPLFFLRFFFWFMLIFLGHVWGSFILTKLDFGFSAIDQNHQTQFTQLPKQSQPTLDLSLFTSNLQPLMLKILACVFCVIVASFPDKRNGFVP